MIRYFVGGLSRRIHGEPVLVDGDVLCSIAFEPSKHGLKDQDYSSINLFLDSGAFQGIRDSDRRSHAAVLDLQLAREQQLSTTAYALATNDRLIDEKVILGKKVKQRWTVDEGWQAVKQTIEAAEWLASQRGHLGQRICVLGCQGVDAKQYAVCVREVLETASDRDWIGLGGWCILGQQQLWMPTFRQTLIECIPLIAASPVKHVHIYGVMFEPALGNLLWVCDQYGLTCSTDSKKALSDCRWQNPYKRKRAGARMDHYRDNLNWWRSHLGSFRQTAFYQSPYAGSVTQRSTKRRSHQLALPLL